jgi:hypothetical protein
MGPGSRTVDPPFGVVGERTQDSLGPQGGQSGSVASRLMSPVHLESTNVTSFPLCGSAPFGISDDATLWGLIAMVQMSDLLGCNPYREHTTPLLHCGHDPCSLCIVTPCILSR